VIWRLAWRGLLRNPRRTGVVLVAVAVGISGCFLTIAINAGLAAQMVETAIETGLGHIQIHASGFAADPEIGVVLPAGASAEMLALDETPGIQASARRVLGEGLLSSTHASVGVRVVAVEPDREPHVSNLARSLVAGVWLDGSGGRVVIGRDLAEHLRVGLGSKIVLSVQDVGGDLTGNAYRVAGLMHTSSREVNQRTVLMHIEQAQSLFDIGLGVSEIVLLAERRGDIVEVRTALAAALGDRVEVRSWDELEPLLVYLVDVMDQMAWVIYAGVFIAMAFGIANVLLMSVYERTREIGVMMAMGMRSRRVVTSVVIESLVVTMLGLAIGLAIGWAGVLLLADGIPLGGFGAGLDEFGIEPRIVPVLRMNDVVAPLLMAVVAAFLASAWPAIRASGLRPSEALRRV
jgi:putative ABC transport system permease protein